MEDEHTPVVLDYMKDFDACGTQTLNTMETNDFVKFQHMKM